MTCVIGLVDKGRVWIGADSAGSSGWETRSVSTPKIFVNGPFLIGYTSSFRMGQILQYQLKVREQFQEEADHSFMASGFCEAVRHSLKDCGFAEVDKNKESGGVFLVGYRGALYEMQADFSLLQYRDQFSAIGVGASYALGALAALEHLPPEERIMRSLAITAGFCNGVDGPFVLMDDVSHGGVK